MEIYDVAMRSVSLSEYSVALIDRDYQSEHIAELNEYIRKCDPANNEDREFIFMVLDVTINALSINIEDDAERLETFIQLVNDLGYNALVRTDALGRAYIFSYNTMRMASTQFDAMVAAFEVCKDDLAQFSGIWSSISICVYRRMLNLLLRRGVSSELQVLVKEITTRLRAYSKEDIETYGAITPGFSIR